MEKSTTTFKRHCQIKMPLSGRWPRSRLNAMTERSPFRYFKTSPEIIRLAVIVYFRFLKARLAVKLVVHPET